MNMAARLHTHAIHHGRATINRLHILCHLTTLLFMLYHRTSNLLFHLNNPPIFLAWSLLTISESIMAFIWLLSQAFRWLPVSRSVFPQNATKHNLPPIDVFICTADPTKEPTIEVMNTVISALALDYPVDKLSVYLSDDGGCYVTSYAVKQACEFAKCWVPFCRKYGIKTRCPLAYFSFLPDDERICSNHEFLVEEKYIKSKYEIFKTNVDCVGEKDTNSHPQMDRPPFVEIIHDNKDGEDTNKMPRLVYVSRERRTNYPHRFKAGALNTLLRVSGIMSNAPYILVLDCDMYCHDPTSARQAMCFHLDPQLSPSLAFVQYPQVFYNVSKNDIYDGRARSAYTTKWQGMDGLRGPLLSGTGFYLKRNALYGSPDQPDKYLLHPEMHFGDSSKLAASLKYSNYKTQQVAKKEENSLVSVLEEAKRLASCAYEADTKWGREVGFSYDCVLESTFTGYLLHCKGWKSVYLYPKRPCFLGCTPIDMKDAMVQLRKWNSELVQVGLSRFSPLTYGVSRMSVLQSMCYGYFTLQPLLSLAVLLYGIVPQICLFMGVSLYPKVSSPWFAVFATVYVSSLCGHLYEVLSTGATLTTFWNEQRMWSIRSVSGSLFGCLDVIMKRIGIQRGKFRITNKAVDKEKLDKYEKGRFNFDGAAFFMIPLALLAVLNLICFFAGLRRVILDSSFLVMFGQLFMSSSILVLSYPILQGIIPIKRKTN